MQNKNYVLFTKEMKKDYTILVPNMLPMHFKLIESVFRLHGFNFKVLETSGKKIADTGLRYTHNDACYPAVLVIGQFMDALLSGEYDTHKTALLMFQTGGGCRASNYVSLIRKALVRAGMAYVPVISFNFTGVEKHPGFRLTLPLMLELVYAVAYGDLLMNVLNQVRPYEKKPGEAEKKALEWTRRLAKELKGVKKKSYSSVKRNYDAIVKDFATIERTDEKKPRVGIVGEIFVKYSPLGNNDLERFLIREGAETVVPGLIDFCLYCIYNGIIDYKFYGRKRAKSYLSRFLYRFVCKKRDDISRALEKGGFRPQASFDSVVGSAGKLISHAVKMGEGWLLTAEMLELAEGGCSNIVCTQPFGCLPNHICGKGMMKPIRDIRPDVNIVAIDYDPGASRVNQENRLKLMLSNAKTAGEK